MRWLMCTDVLANGSKVELLMADPRVRSRCKTLVYRRRTELYISTLHTYDRSICSCKGTLMCSSFWGIQVGDENNGAWRLRTIAHLRYMRGTGRRMITLSA